MPKKNLFHKLSRKYNLKTVKYFKLENEQRVMTVLLVLY